VIYVRHGGRCPPRLRTPEFLTVISDRPSFFAGLLGPSDSTTVWVSKNVAGKTTCNFRFSISVAAVFLFRCFIFSQGHGSTISDFVGKRKSMCIIHVQRILVSCNKILHIIAITSRTSTPCAKFHCNIFTGRFLLNM